MKIHPLRLGVSFHPSVSSYIFLCADKRAKTHKSMLINLRLHHTKAAAYTCDIISNAPAVNTINSSDVFECTLLHCELHNNVTGFAKRVLCMHPIFQL